LFFGIVLAVAVLLLRVVGVKVERPAGRTTLTPAARWRSCCARTTSDFGHGSPPIVVVSDGCRGRPGLARCANRWWRSVTRGVMGCPATGRGGAAVQSRAGRPAGAGGQRQNWELVAPVPGVFWWWAG